MVVDLEISNEREEGWYDSDLRKFRKFDLCESSQLNFMRLKLSIQNNNKKINYIEIPIINSIGVGRIDFPSVEL